MRLTLAEGDGTGGPGGSPGGAPPAAQEWFTGLPDTLKPDAAVFEPYKDKPVTDVLGAYRDLSKKAADFAVPATPAEYGITLPSSLAEMAKDPETGKYLNAELERTLAKAHAEGLSVKQAQARVELETKEFLLGLEASKKESAEAMKALETQWGDKFVANKALVEREIAALSEKRYNAVQKSSMANDPHLMEIFFDLANARSEGRLRAGGDEGVSKKSHAERLYGGTK
jgi:hypothetical protein